MRNARTLRRGGFLAALAVISIGAFGGAATTASGPTAAASAASCDGRAFGPIQRVNRVIAKGSLTCHGDVRVMRLKTCLLQVVNGKTRFVACKTRARLGPGRVIAKVNQVCTPSDPRGFRTRTYLFLRDESGRADRGRARSGLARLPKLC